MIDNGVWRVYSSNSMFVNLNHCTRDLHCHPHGDAAGFLQCHVHGAGFLHSQEYAVCVCAQVSGAGLVHVGDDTLHIRHPLAFASGQLPHLGVSSQATSPAASSPASSPAFFFHYSSTDVSLS